MDPARWERLEVLLEEASGLPEQDRAAFVEREAGDDPELRTELRGLLGASGGAVEYLARLRGRLLGSGVAGLLSQAPDPGTPDPWIGRTVSHYRILDRIGSGGMGVVYRARDLTLDREVALKFIAPELRRDPRAEQRFLHEARAASALDHPNICTVHEVAESGDGRLFIVMSAYDGETLRTRLERGTLPDTEALAIGEQVARALTAAHERGIVHRDVKPDNVFLTRDGGVKLLDFGLAHTAGSQMSGAGAVGGTLAYMSPEQLRGARADERSDVWALGVILHEMLTGTRPADGHGATGSPDPLAATAAGPGDASPALSPRIGAVIRRALAPDPTDRFADAGQLLEALTAAGIAPPGRSRARRVGVAVTVLTALAVLVAPWRHQPTVAPPVRHVLWVDDDPANNRFIIEQFTGLGVQVTTARHTAEGLALYDSATHQLVISDMGRFEGPEGGYVDRAGLELLEALRARNPAVQLVFCTSARAVETYRAEALAAGARDIGTECERFLQLLGVEPRHPK